jgi:hypothetical protein
MLQELKNTPAMEKAILKRIGDLFWNNRLYHLTTDQIGFALFDMGRKGFKLEDITVEAVLKFIDQTAGV